MNILVLTRCRPHRPVGGADLRDWQNIRGLSQLGQVDVISVGVDSVATAVNGARAWTGFPLAQRSRWECARTAFWPLRPGSYGPIDAYHINAVTRWIERRTAQRPYDIAVVEGISLASYIADLKRLGCRVVFDAHNIESTLHAAVLSALSNGSRSMARRLKDRIVERRMARVEGQAVRAADMVWACSEIDASGLERACRARKVAVVPNGVDVDAYTRRATTPAESDWSSTPVTLLYQGLFGYGPNADAARRLIRDVLPALRHRGVEARLVFVGRDPTPEMLNAAAKDLAIEVTGAVKSVLPYLDQPCVVTLPIALGSGTRLKILEAFAAGRPVVTTTKGAEGLEVTDGTHLLIRDDPDRIANAVISLWEEPGLRRRLCRNALELVSTKYSWPEAARRIALSLDVLPANPAVGHSR